MKYVSIRTATLRPNTSLNFDVYVYYQDTYLLFRDASQSFEQDLLEKFKAKKVKKAFIPEEQEESYLTYLDSTLVQLQDSSVSLGDKAEFAQDTLKQEADSIEKNLESEAAYKKSEERIQKVVDFILAEPKALAGMLTAAGLSIDDSAHGSTVSSLALAVGSASGLVDREDLTNLAVAGLLHDTGLKPLGFSVTDSLANLPKDKWSIFKKHPAKAVELVAGKKFITTKVLRIIEDHEELGGGLGFPEKKNLARLAIDSQIFNLCDALDHFSIEKKRQAPECVEEFIEKHGEKFEIQLLEVLEKKIKA